MFKLKVLTVSLLVPFVFVTSAQAIEQAQSINIEKVSKNANVKRWLEADKRIFLLPHMMVR
jgi:hypothetical protein